MQLGVIISDITPPAEGYYQWYYPPPPNWGLLSVIITLSSIDPLETYPLYSFVYFSVLICFIWFVLSSSTSGIWFCDGGDHGYDNIDPNMRVSTILNDTQNP